MFETIEKIVNDFIIENDFAEVSAIIGEDFCYYDDLNTIVVSLVVPEENMKSFRKFAFDNGLKFDCGDFILAFFHELGHSETIDLLEDNEIRFSQNKKRFLQNNMEDYETYMRLPDEFSATSWAIDYINNNFEKVKIFAKKLEKEFLKIIEE